ncbi:MAG TPA: ATP-binding protein [Candidatus Saccharimonadales bacterium]|nr:ATP-binding protein [Candidatus Saccharimonadales bacterium]
MQFNVIYYTLYLSAILGIIIISFLVYSRRREPEYRYFAIFSVLLSLWLTFQFCTQLFSDNFVVSTTLLLRLSVAVAPFFAIYFYFFAIEHAGLKARKKIHFILPAILALVTIQSSLAVQSGTASIDGITLRDGPLYFPIFGVAAAYILVSIFYMFKGNKSPKVSSNPARKQANNILIAGVLQALIIISLAAIFLSEEPLAQVLSPFALFLMVAIFSYAIIRHQLFDIRLIAVRALTYSFSLVTIAALYSLLAFGLINTALEGQHDFLQKALYLFIALLLALTFSPLKSFFDRITRTIFYQDSYKSQEVIDRFSSTLVSTVDIKDLSQNAGEILRSAIKSQYIAILLAPTSQEDTKPRIMIDGQDKGLNQEELYGSLSKHSERLFIQDEIYGDRERQKVFKSMHNSSCAVAARLETHGDFIGYVLFGLKNNGKPYTHQDIELIRITTDELALGIQNTLRFEEIQSFNVTLQAKVNEATSQLRRTNTELRRLDEAKDEFVSMASHQLRTPLTSVKGYLSMVLEGDAGKISDTQKKLLGEAFTSSERMVHLINDFLNVSRLQTGKFMLESRALNLAKIVGQEVDSLQSTAGAHALKLRYRMPSHFPILYIDESKIRQVVMNFIDNSIYYSKEDSTITVTLEIEDSEAVLKVHDTGIGVPEAEQVHIFTKFFRAANARRQRPDGTGVGLFLAKKVIVAHGGSMVFESTESEGSTFGFRLPIKKLSTAPADDTDELKK